MDVSSRQFPMQYLWLLIAMLFVWNVEKYLKSVKDGCTLSPDDIITYDVNDYEIKRSDAFIAGKMQTKPVFMTIGIPIVFREYQKQKAIYFDKTLNALLKPLSNDEKKTIQIIVLLVDTEIKKRQKMLNLLINFFRHEIEIGLINVIGIPQRFYPPYKNLPQTLSDSPERMIWRSKQSLDYAFLFNYVFATSEYYLQIEEDVIADENYYHVIKNDIEITDKISRLRYMSKPPNHSERHGKLWGMLTYYKYGFIGRLFPTEYTKTFASFLKSNYAFMPCDWVLDSFAKIYNIDSNHKPSLFEHIGKQSSSLGT